MILATRRRYCSRETGEEYKKKVLILKGPGRPGPDAKDEELTSPPDLRKYVTFEAFREDQARRHLDMKMQ